MEEEVVVGLEVNVMVVVREEVRVGMVVLLRSPEKELLNSPCTVL